MEVSYKIARARVQDLDQLAAIELAAAKLLEGYAPAAVLNEATSLQEFTHAQAEGRLWVVLARDTPVGFAHLEFHGTRKAHLKELDVHPDHGRRGLGARLVTTVCQWAADHDYLEMTLTTFRDVPWNMPFYARQGFDVVASDDLSPSLQSILKQEARSGLDPARRVAMRRRLTSSADVSR